MASPQRSGLKRGNFIENQLSDQKKPRSEHPKSLAGRHLEIDDEPTPLNKPQRQYRDPTPISQRIMSSSPKDDTQAYSQFYPARPLADDVEDEASEGVWGYLLPLGIGNHLVLKRREVGNSTEVDKHHPSISNQLERRPLKKSHSNHPGGYLIGRHPECDLIIRLPTISNRHCLIYDENKDGDSVAILEDLSSNGTFINEALVGKYKQRQLHEGDEIAVLDEARFVFRYPKTKETSTFRQKFRVLRQLGKGHYASVYRCVERATGLSYAVKQFEKRRGDFQRQDSEILQREIAVLKKVSHQNVLGLKDAFDERDGVYIVLELAPAGELFNCIISKQKLTERETRKVFRQLFSGLKYLHDMNIVHRDIKPENILLADENLTVKLADFGLAKIIGEDSFTTTLCGTPSYVAPEVLERGRSRQYDRAVDVWSMGVVLYICLCGFPPFSDELYSEDYPYSLADQIKLGKFNYPSPYWDSIGDPALDLIDRMLTVDPDQRITVDECLHHPWLISNSSEGITMAMGQINFSRRKIAHERTLLSSINHAKVSKHVDVDSSQENGSKVKIFEGNEAGRRIHNYIPKKKMLESGPAATRQPDEFMRIGGQGDQILCDPGKHE